MSDVSVTVSYQTKRHSNISLMIYGLFGGLVTLIFINIPKDIIKIIQ